MFSSQICANVSDGLTCYAATVGLLICTLISDLRNQGQFQNLEKFHILQTLIFFWVSTLIRSWFCLNVSTTPLRQWGFQQRLLFSWTTLRGKHCRHPIAIMGVVDTFGPYNIHQKETWLATLKVSGSENLDFFSGWQLGKISGATLKITFQGAD